MADPGFQASLFAAAPSLGDVPEMLEHDYAGPQPITLGDDYQALWWKFTPTQAGLFSIDGYASTAIDGTQPAGLIVAPLVGGFAGPPSSWTALAGEVEDGRQRALYLISEEGVGETVLVAAYGAVVDVDFNIDPNPILMTVRIGDIVPFTLDDDAWEHGPESTHVINPIYSTGYLGGEPGIPGGSQLAWATSATVDAGEGADDPFVFFDTAWSLGRRTWQGEIASDSTTGYTYWRRINGAESAVSRESTPPDVMPPWQTPDIVSGQLVGMYVKMVTHNRLPADVGLHEYAMVQIQGGYRSISLSASNVAAGVSADPPDAPSGDVLRLYDANEGPNPYGGNARLLKLEVAPDEVISSNTYGHPNWVSSPIDWYMATVEAARAHPWGLHYHPQGEVTTDIGGTEFDLPVINYSAAGPESYDAGGMWSKVANDYAGGAGGAWHEIPTAVWKAAAAWEETAYAEGTNYLYAPGLVFTAVAEAQKSNTPPIEASDMDPDHWVGRWEQYLAFRVTAAVRYQDLEKPELFELTPPFIDAAFDLSRCAFT